MAQKKSKGNSPPSPEQWGKLFEAAAAVKALAPWEALWDTDLVTLFLPSRREPVYCSVMGKNGSCYGIGVYPGFESLSGYYRLLDSPDDEPPFIKLGYQKCLMCYYGDREEIAPQDREVLKQLGLKFRGRNNWIYFRAMETGFYPWFLSAAQAVLMTEALQNLAMACKHLKTGDLNVDFDKGETLTRLYSPEQKEWLNFASPLPYNPPLVKMFFVRDETLVKSLQIKKMNAARLEFDLIYMPTPIQEDESRVPWLPRAVLLAEKGSGLLVDQAMLAEEEESEQAVLQMLAKFIREHGRPASLSVRDEFFAGYVKDLCDKIKVKLLIGEDMSCINKIAKDLSDFLE